MSNILFSTSPHVRSGNSTKKIMQNVCISLLPAVIMGIVYFGIFALLTILVAVVSAVGSEIVYRLAIKEKFEDIISSFDYTSVVTGLIIALIIPANAHLYIPAFASIFAIVVVKMLFGGTGYNLVNPAAAGRIFAFISFTTVMNTFVAPSIGAINSSVITGATSLQSFLNDGSSLSSIDLLLGTGVAGCIGETCKIAILIGAIYLAVKKIIKIWLPIISVAVAGIVAVLLNGTIDAFLPAILSGGLLFGAFFMATDYVTNPVTTFGNVIFFILFGALTSILRHFTGYETASFAILMMNVLVPLIDKISTVKPFGYTKPQKEAK
ncbi:MAG: RnfABCDGE type electron transport complex subunit D [Clostridia bacterium]|nr:RnfABCDGE type electron transport complex subunit D [Clostridia bacterium]